MTKWRTYYPTHLDTDFARELHNLSEYVLLRYKEHLCPSGFSKIDTRALGKSRSELLACHYFTLGYAWCTRIVARVH